MPTESETRAIRVVRPWAEEIRADWATALTRIASVRNDLPPIVEVCLDEVTLRLDRLVEVIDDPDGATARLHGGRP